MTHQCETNCGRPAPTTTICNHCIEQLTQAYYDALGRPPTTGLASLYNMATGQESTPTNGIKANSRHADVLIAGIYDCWETLRKVNVKHVQHHHTGARAYTATMKAIQQADELLNPVEQAASQDHINRQMRKIKPRTPPYLAEFMKNNLGERISPARIRRLVEQGDLKPSHTDHTGTPHIHPASLLHTLDRLRGKDNRP